MTTDTDPPQLPPPLSPLQDAYLRVWAELDNLAEVSSVSSTDDQLIWARTLHAQLETRLSSAGLQLTADVIDRRAFAQTGAPSVQKYLSGALRVANSGVYLRRVHALTTRTTLTGEVQPPQYPNLAEGHAAGEITTDNIDLALRTMGELPAALEPELKEFAEETFASAGRDLSLDDMRKVSRRILEYVNPDGKYDEEFRKKKRAVVLRNQEPGESLMSQLAGWVTPSLRAKIELLFAMWGAPGVNNPADVDSPSGSAEGCDAQTLSDAARRDERTVGQRNHDALEALLDVALAGGTFGATHRGLPAQIVVTIDEDTLRAQAGLGTTTGGTAMPLQDVIELAAEATPHLAVFKNHTNQVLYLGTAQRLASPAQRLALFARDRGCTAPGCDAPFLHSEIHHVKDWADGGTTDIDGLTAACGPHNRHVGKNPTQMDTFAVPHGPNAGRILWGAPSADGSTRVYRFNDNHHVEHVVRGWRRKPTARRRTVKPVKVDG